MRNKKGDIIIDTAHKFDNLNTRANSIENCNFSILNKEKIQYLNGLIFC